MQCNTIPIENIVQFENSRGKHQESDLANLMSSIKKNGLLQPIGVRKIGVKGKNSKDRYEVVFGNRRFEAVKKLGQENISAIVLDTKNRKEFLLINLIENAQRSDITVYEQGRIFSTLKEKEDMSYSEISARVGLPLGRVKASVAIFQDTPKEFRDKIVFGKGGGSRVSRKGNIPIALAESIIMGCKRNNLSTKDKSKLLKAASNDKLGRNNLSEVFNLIQSGKKVEKVIEQMDKVKNLLITLPVFQKDIEKWNQTWDGDLVEEIRDIIYSNKALNLRNPF